MAMIIAPHLGDEVLGCASFLTKDALVVYVTVGRPGYPNGENQRERDKVASLTGFHTHQLAYGANAVTSYAALLADFERLLEQYVPVTVLIPYPTYNQDHRIVYEAALTAMRPHDRLHFVSRILVYEEPDVFGTMRPGYFRPAFFRTLDIDRKLDLYRMYQSQVCGHRSPKHVESIAAIRGMQSNMDYAEAFEVARWVQ